MLVKALKSFSGTVSMAKGQIMDVEDVTVLDDLIQAKYVEEVKSEIEVAKPKKTTKKK